MNEAAMAPSTLLPGDGAEPARAVPPGRATEIAQVEAFLRGPPGQVLVIQGPPGSGRRTLVQAALANQPGSAPAQLSHGQARGWIWLDARPLRRGPELRSLAQRWGWDSAPPPTAAQALQQLATLDNVSVTLVISGADPADWLAAELPVARGEARTVVLAEPGPLPGLLSECGDQLLELAPLQEAARLEILSEHKELWQVGLQPTRLATVLGGWPWLLRLAAAQAAILAEQEGAAGLASWQGRLLAAPQPVAEWLLEAAYARLSAPGRAMALALAAAGGEHHPQWVDAPLGRALANDAVAELSRHGWLQTDPEGMILGRLCLPLVRWLELRPEFANYAAALARHLCVALLQRLEQWPARARLVGLRRQLPWLWQYLARHHPATAALLLERCDGLLQEAGLAEEVLSAAQEVLAVTDQGDPAQAQVLLPLARSCRALQQFELADAWLAQARQQLRFTPCAAPDQPRPCRSRYADALSTQALDLDAWLASADPVEVPLDAAPADVDPGLGDRWLMARALLLMPLPTRAERHALCALEQAQQQRHKGSAVLAWQLLEPHLAVLQQLPRLDDQARALSAVAQSRQDVGQYSEAAELFGQEAARWQRSEQSLAEALALHRQALALAAGGATRLAIAADQRSRQALQRWQRIGDTGELRQLARAQVMLGQALANRGDTDEARESLLRAVELCRKIEAVPEDPTLRAALLELERLADG